jgi:hypothetical protein
MYNRNEKNIYIKYNFSSNIFGSRRFWWGNKQYFDLGQKKKLLSDQFLANLHS